MNGPRFPDTDSDNGYNDTLEDSILDERNVQVEVHSMDFTSSPNGIDIF
jgi:hypothetical protein